MKNKLEVQQFSLTRILENLDRIPSNGKFDDGELKKLTPQEKKRLLELVSKYNEYGRVLRCEQAIVETAKTISEIHKLAEAYALTESSDWFQGEVVSRDFKSLGANVKDFNKLSKECYGKLMQLNALFENIGTGLARYFEISSLDEIASKANVQLKPTPTPNTENDSEDPLLQ